MSKLNELIQELCPDGVEYKPLEELCSITTGKLNANAKNENGLYPFFTCDAEPYKINEYAFDTTAIIISGNGSQVGHINFYSGKFNAYQRTYVLDSFRDVSEKFLLHFLKAYLKPYVIKNSKKGSVPYITLPMLGSFKIPTPPLEVQQEIVRILDGFTELTTALTTELTTELTARKQQFEYYRDELLTFENDAIEYKPIKDCVLCIDNIKWAEYPSKTFQYIDLSSVDRGNHCIYNTSPITMENAPCRAQQLVQTGDVLIGTTRPLLKRFCVIPAEYNHEICSTGFCVLRPNQKIVLSQWLYYVISSTKFFSYAEKNQQGASYPSISDKKVKEFNIPVPSIKDQQKLIGTLNNFETLCSGLSNDLPAEIESLQKQYEYYRDKLLTFKEKMA